MTGVGGQALAGGVRQTTIAKLLAHGATVLAHAGVEDAPLNAQLLLSAACGVERAILFRDSAELATPAHEYAYSEFLRRRVAREPLQYIVGKQEFWSLDFEVTPDVLIPRPETELLVELAIKSGGGGQGPGARPPTPIRICDVGTGSGCIAAALAMELPNAEITAVDLSATALEVALANARRHAVDARIRFLQSDLLDAVDLTFDLIVSNPPYVALRDRPTLQPELSHEPALALFAGSDGIEVIRRLIPQAASKLLPQGVLLMEIGADQAAEVTELALAGGFSDATIENDLAGLPRALVARK